MRDDRADKKEETLIFLPGASGNIGFWQPVMSLLSERYAKKIIAYPEFGGIPAQSGIRNFDDLQRYVLHSIRHLSEHNTSVVVAQSMGGIFAVQTALQHPQQIKALVLVATSGGVDLSPFYVEDWREDYQLNFSVPDWFVNQHTALDNQLKHIHCPVLLIWGDQDPISPVAVGEYLQSVFRNAQLHIIHQGQHDLAFQYAEQVTHLIDDFIQSI